MYDNYWVQKEQDAPNDDCLEWNSHLRKITESLFDIDLF